MILGTRRQGAESTTWRLHRDAKHSRHSQLSPLRPTRCRSAALFQSRHSPSSNFMTTFSIPAGSAWSNLRTPVNPVNPRGRLDVLWFEDSSVVAQHHASLCFTLFQMRCSTGPRALFNQVWNVREKGPIGTLVSDPRRRVGVPSSAPVTRQVSINRSLVEQAFFD